MSYRFAVEKRALDKVLTLTGANQWQVYVSFDAVALHPFRESDLMLKDGVGGFVSVKIFGDILAHYHVDHAMKRVLVLDFEIVDDTA